jgi:hypothetical protein
LIQSNRLAGLTRTAPQPVVNKSRSPRQSAVDFGAAFREIQRDPARIRRAAAENLPPVTPVPSTPGPGTVIVSPFNPLGFPISATPAPTTAEVEANPDRWRGTSFDPALRILP